MGSSALKDHMENFSSNAAGCHFNGTACNLSTLREDAEDSILNPHLYPQTTADNVIGYTILAVSTLGFLMNFVILLKLPCDTKTQNFIIRCLAAVDSLLILEILVQKLPLLLLDQNSVLLQETFPYLLLACLPLHRVLVTFSSFLLLILVGWRHLNQMERSDYRCLNPIIFSLCLALTVGLPKILETDVMALNASELQTLHLMEDFEGHQVLVVTHTHLFHLKTFKDLFRMLFTFLASQITTIWFLPIIFLHSLSTNGIYKKLRKKRDPLTPILAFLAILLSLPFLVIFSYKILLSTPPHLLFSADFLCLTLFSSLKLPLYLLDSALAFQLSFIRNYRALARPRTREY